MSVDQGERKQAKRKQGGASEKEKAAERGGERERRTRKNEKERNVMERKERKTKKAKDKVGGCTGNKDKDGGLSSWLPA